MKNLRSIVAERTHLINELIETLVTTVHSVAKDAEVFAAEEGESIREIAKAAESDMQNQKDLALNADKHWEYRQSIEFILQEATKAIVEINKLSYPSGKLRD